jgi:hypothetical protein
VTKEADRVEEELWDEVTYLRGRYPRSRAEWKRLAELERALEMIRVTRMPVQGPQDMPAFAS